MAGRDDLDLSTTSSSSSTSHAPAPGSAPKKHRRGGALFAKENRRLVAGLLVGALVAVFAVLNRDEVEVNWILGTWSTPLIVVIALSMVVGAALALLATRRRSGGGD